MLEEALATQPPSDGSDPGEEVAVKHVYALHTLANLYRQAGDMERALECLERGGALATQKQLPMALAYHYTSIAHLHLQEGRIEESVARYRNAIQLTRRARYASGLAQSLRIFGAVLVGLGRHEEALPHLYEAATTFAQLRDPEGEAAAWSAIGAAEEHLQSYSAALSAWSRSALLLRKLDNRTGELAALEGLARTTRLHVPEPALALDCYERAVQLAETLGEEQAEGRMRNVMGILEWNRGEHARALAHYERAFSLFEHLDDDAHAGLMLNGIAATLRALGRSSEAESRLNEALTLHRRSRQVQLEGHALGLLGEIHLERGEVEPGAECFTRSLAIRDRTGDRRGAGWMRHGLARCALAGAAPFRVREHLEAAAAIAAEVDDAELADTCRQLRRIADF